MSRLVFSFEEEASKALSITPYVLVYGTLISSSRNNYRLDDAAFVGDGVTEDKRFVMGGMGIPYVFDRAGMDDPDGLWGGIIGEVYDLSACKDQLYTMISLDDLEGYPHGYDRQVVTVELDGRKVQAWMYYMDRDMISSLVNPRIDGDYIWNRHHDAPQQELLT